MAKPAWKMPWPEGNEPDEPDFELEDDDQQEGSVVVQRVVERPDGSLDLVELRLKGHRLDARRRYQPIAPDAQGRLLSETTGLWFGVSADGQRIDVFEAQTGERVLTPEEIQEGCQAAEKKAARASVAQKAAEKEAARQSAARRLAEAELEQLRAEVERLKSGR